MPIIPVISARIKTTRVTVGTTATLLPTTASNSRRVVTIQSLTDKDLYIGNEDVATSGATTGLVIPAKWGTVTFEINQRVPIYGIVASDTTEVVILEGA